MSSKLRVYEVARDLGMDNKELVTLLQSIGFSEIKNHMSVVPSEAIDRAKRQLERKNEPNKVVEERIRPTVVKRRAAVKRPEEGATDSSSSIAVAQPVAHRDVAAHQAVPAVSSAPAVEARPSAPSATQVTAEHESSASAKASVKHEDVSVAREAMPDAAKAVATMADSAVAEPAIKAPVPDESKRVSPASPPAEKVQLDTPAAPSVVAPVAAMPVHHVEAVAEKAPESPKAEAQPAVAAVVESGKSHAEPVKAESAAVQPTQSESIAEKTEKTEPVKPEPIKTEPAKAQPAKTEPAKTQPAKHEAERPLPGKVEQGAVGRKVEAPRGDTARADAPKVAVNKGSAPIGKPEWSRPDLPKGQSGPAERSGSIRPPAPAGGASMGGRPGDSRPPLPPTGGSGPRVITSPAPGARPSTPPGPPQATRPSSPPRTGIEVWEGRPGVPMSPAHRAPVPRRVQYDAKAGAAAQRRPGQPAQRGARGPAPRGRGPGGTSMGGMGSYGRGGPMGGRAAAGAPPATQERGAHKRVVKIEGSIGLQTLAGRMGVKAHELLRKLIMLGMTGVNINSTLDADTAKIVASEFGWEVEDVAVSEEQALVIAQGVETEAESGEREPRPPVVTVMGHVDHGKTSLLDRIRKANVAAGEAGGITQHIGAYSVETTGGRITFLDTPGHEAFTAMRARGAQTTDIVILVVAADDGVMPQTREAVAHAKAAKVPLVVAINKCDKPEAQPDRCRRELAELGLVPEEWGGETLYSEVSAHTGKGIDELLERVLLQAEMLDLRANPNKLAVGVVIEAQLDRGRGPVATMLVTDGTLKRGDVLLVGAASGKVRAMLDSMGRSLAEAGPSTPVEVIGLNDVPAAGDPVHVVKDLKKAQELADSRKIKERRSLMPSGGQRLTLEELYKAMKETEQLELKVIVKADVHGSVEAVSDSLVRLSTEKVKVTVVHSAAGAITEGDVNLAVAAGAIIIGFNVRPAGKAASLAAQEKVEVRQYNIIYNVVDDVKAAMEGLLSPSLVEKVLGQAQVRQVFRVSKAGNVAGCMVTQGLIRRSGSIRLTRDGAMLWSGKLSALKRFKDDAREVKEGFDCGISLDGFQDIKEGDMLECFEMEEVRQTL